MPDRSYSEVLIDTWWNVNVGNVANLTIMNGVLIDTWWNVNFIRKSANYKNGNGFNRYMVECESGYVRRDVRNACRF